MAAEFLIIDAKAGAMSQEPGIMEISNVLLNLANIKYAIVCFMH